MMPVRQCYSWSRTGKHFFGVTNLTDDEIIPEFECHDVKPTNDFLRIKKTESQYANGFDNIKNDENFSYNDEVVKGVVNNIKSEFYVNNEEKTIEKFNLMPLQFYDTNESDVRSNCEVCQKAFGQKSHLKKHTESIHNNLKRY
ncbi:hypothetical protein TKK_0003657 [Trichogramma kaykai]